MHHMPFTRHGTPHRIPDPTFATAAKAINRSTLSSYADPVILVDVGFALQDGAALAICPLRLFALVVSCSHLRLPFHDADPSWSTSSRALFKTESPSSRDPSPTTIMSSVPAPKHCPSPTMSILVLTSTSPPFKTGPLHYIRCVSLQTGHQLASPRHPSTRPLSILSTSRRLSSSGIREISATDHPSCSSMSSAAVASLADISFLPLVDVASCTILQLQQDSPRQRVASAASSLQSCRPPHWTYDLRPPPRPSITLQDWITNAHSRHPSMTLLPNPSTSRRLSSSGVSET